MEIQIIPAFRLKHPKIAAKFDTELLLFRATGEESNILSSRHRNSAHFMDLNWPAGCLAGWLAGWPAGWLAGWLASYGILWIPLDPYGSL